jgi:hypothetical protein
MAWRPASPDQAGKLGNTLQCSTIGGVQLTGLADRLKLKIAVNCHSEFSRWNFHIQRTSGWAVDAPRIVHRSAT